jgi:hypothetical protein
MALVTVKQILDDTGIKYNQRDLCNLGRIVKNRYTRTFKKEPVFIPVVEGRKKFTVRAYDDSYRSVLIDVIINYFTRREEFIKGIEERRRRLKKEYRKRKKLRNGGK